MKSKQTLVVIGNGMVGQNFLSTLVESGANQRYQIVTFCEEPRPAYDRVHLSEYFAGKTADDLSLVPDGFFELHGISIYMGDKAIVIDRQSKQVTSAKGVVVRYDKLVLATGSYPFVPPVPGHDRPRTHSRDVPGENYSQWQSHCNHASLPGIERAGCGT